MEELHRLLWSRAGQRLRVHIKIADLAQEFGVYYTLMEKVVDRMKQQGRIRFVECKRGKRYIYEIANPNTYDHREPESHAQRPRKPVWG